MRNTCSAPGCRSNYSGEPYTPVFRIPSNSELREKWLRGLHREDTEDLENVFVYSNHFRTEDVITEMDMPQPDGSLQKISRRPILHKIAIPCLLPSCPKYLSSSSPKPESLDRGKIESKLFFQTLEQSFDLHKAEDSNLGVKSLGELKCKLEEFELPSSWVKWFSDDTSINLLKLSKDKHICIYTSICFN
ncbi:hypothetical protein LOD99_5205 [Oopsacas minuta]|uniref:THAP-type domain-containing protein n=1 Tax=Oopsacas minuta TaxID=111878 RepID=A0AAV7JRT9_9METZ|nr:hypothetical protein LOD99_5205 [Oopsacas minuta]